jgi:hypothetical protein
LEQEFEIVGGWLHRVAAAETVVFRDPQM